MEIIVQWSAVGYGSTTPLDCSARKPMGPGGSLGSTGRVAGRGVARPTCGHSILRANVPRRRSPASID